MTHRALLLGAVAEGTTVVRRPLDALDTRSTARCVAALGAQLDWPSSGDVAITGVVRPRAPAGALDCGNAGTAARLLAGLLAGRPGRFTLDGDDSLRRRPMGRVVRPLNALGAGLDGERLPLTVGGARLRGGVVDTGVPSAQVKSALLLAGLVAEGPVTVREAVPTRDHTERMLPAFGVGLERHGSGAVTVSPGRPRAARVDVPADPSAAAFLALAALLVPDSEVVLADVGLWPTRTGWMDALTRAGAPLTVHGRRTTGGDPVGDVHVTAGPLRAFDIAPEQVPDLVDEIPALALAASRAEGTSRFAGLGELRIKESDRVAGVASLLAALGVPVEVRDDELRITGVRAFVDGPTDARGDHRLALCAAVARAVSAHPARPLDPSAAVSWPGFDRELAALARG